LDLHRFQKGAGSIPEGFLSFVPGEDHPGGGEQAVEVGRKRGCALCVSASAAAGEPCSPRGVRTFRSIETMTVHDRIEINPKIMLGKPVIRGTRIPVELIVRKLSEGADEKAMLEAYPKLTAADVHAALRYAADSLAHEEVVLSAAG
jgi:uncharacterized protein (DUF433 family)